MLSFPEVHTADNISAATKSIMEEWGIQDKVTSMVTDAAANMIASVRSLHLKHALCFAHSLNLVVKKSTRSSHKGKESCNQHNSQRGAQISAGASESYEEGCSGG